MVPKGKWMYSDQTNETAPIACAALPSTFSDARPPEVCTLQLPSYTCSVPVVDSPVSGSVTDSPGRVTVHRSVIRHSALALAFARKDALILIGTLQSN